MGKLHDAVREYDLEQIKKCVKGSWFSKAVPVDEKDSIGWTALQIAAHNGYCDAILYLVKEGGANVANGVALFAAVDRRQTGAIKCLVLDCGADVNITLGDGDTPLHLAVHRGDVEVARCLVEECGASTTIKNKEGEIAYDKAECTLFGKKKEITSIVALKALLIADKSNFALEKQKTLLRAAFKAARENNIPGIKEVLNLGLSVNAQDEDGRTVLSAVAYEGHIDIVRFLIKECRANVNIADNLGWTPLHRAIHGKKLEVIRCLIKEGGADVHFRPKNGVSSAYDAAKSSDSDNVKKLFFSLVPAKEPQPKTTSPQIQQPIQSPQKNAAVASNSNNNNNNNNNNTPVAQPFTTLEISFAISYSQLKFEKQLGKGGYGIVYQGVWRNTPVAIKQLMTDQFSTEATKEFQHEIQIMAKLRHLHVVQLYGVAMDQSPYCIVMEYMSGGSLFKLLQSSISLNWATRERIALDIAKGLSYLHDEKVLHRDLKSLNVLLDENQRAKLCDFGLAKVKHETATTSQHQTNVAGTLAWMAPELYQGSACSKASDVYSYGMTVWEITSRALPFKNLASPQLIPFQVLQRAEPETIPEDCPPKLAKLIRFCWQKTPGNRPTATRIVEMIENPENENLSESYQGNLASNNNLISDSYQGNLRSMN